MNNACCCLPLTPRFFSAWHLRCCFSFSFFLCTTWGFVTHTSVFATCTDVLDPHLSFYTPAGLCTVQMMSSFCGSVFTCRVESPRDRGPNTPPLRGNKYEVVPPVKARQAFVRYSIVATVLCAVSGTVLSPVLHIYSLTLYMEV